MASLRLQRVEGLIKEALGDLLPKIKDPRVVGFTTITEVKVAPDLSTVKVFVSVIGTSEELEKTVEGLSSAAGYLRNQLGREIRLKKTPQIVFIADTSIEKGVKMVSLIDKVRSEEKKKSPEEEDTEPLGDEIL